MKKTEIYYPDGRVLVREWEDGTRPAYEWCRRAVGEGPIELVSGFMPDGGIDGREQAYSHEEGRLLGLSLNIPGMKAIDWPEPPGGWDSLDPQEPAGPPSGPILFHPGMSPAAQMSARARMREWSPVVGPILVMRGWLEADYDEEKGLNPDSLGEEHRS